MTKDQWYSRLNKWAHEDSRLERLPLVFIRALAEHITSEQSKEDMELRVQLSRMTILYHQNVCSGSLAVCDNPHCKESKQLYLQE